MHRDLFRSSEIDIKMIRMYEYLAWLTLSSPCNSSVELCTQFSDRGLEICKRKFEKWNKERDFLKSKLELVLIENKKKEKRILDD
jgi:hypothetical protein